MKYIQMASTKSSFAAAQQWFPQMLWLFGAHSISIVIAFLLVLAPCEHTDFIANTLALRRAYSSTTVYSAGLVFLLFY